MNKLKVESLKQNFICFRLFAFMPRCLLLHSLRHPNPQQRHTRFYNMRGHFGYL
jgi:hypothetical protein